MSSSINTRATILDAKGGRPVAQIVLNGYNIAAGGPLGRSGALRSFKIIEGSLWDQWNAGARLLIKAEDGQVAEGKIAAHPVENGGTGFIEFV